MGKAVPVYPVHLDYEELFTAAIYMAMCRDVERKNGNEDKAAELEGIAKKLRVATVGAIFTREDAEEVEDGEEEAL